MGDARGFFQSLHWIYHWFFWGVQLQQPHDLLTFEVYIIEIRYGLIFAAFFGLITVVGAAMAALLGGDKVEKKLDRIENKLEDRL